MSCSQTNEQLLRVIRVTGGVELMSVRRRRHAIQGDDEGNAYMPEKFLSFLWKEKRFARCEPLPRFT